MIKLYSYSKHRVTKIRTKVSGSIQMTLPRNKKVLHLELKEMRPEHSIPQYSVRHPSMDILSCSLKCGTSQEAGLFLSWQNYLRISKITSSNKINQDYIDKAKTI